MGVDAHRMRSSAKAWAIVLVGPVVQPMTFGRDDSSLSMMILNNICANGSPSLSPLLGQIVFDVQPSPIRRVPDHVYELLK